MFDNDNLDQLWYTWSTAGLGSMNMGYRVRAASPELHDTNSMRYRQLDRLLRYELPLDMDPSMLDQHTAPISLLFIKNGGENLLIRKVFKGRDAGRDAAGRYSVYFTHLIVVPSSFTAREAISLWNYPFWADSEEGKAANDTLLPTLSSNELAQYINRQPPFDFNSIRQRLLETLLTVLTRGLPPHIYIAGRSELIAAYIYGLTHCLPKTKFVNLTFSTYESNVHEGETAIVGTMRGAELRDPSQLQVQASQPLVQYETALPEVQKCAATLVNCLTSHNMRSVDKMINRLERDNDATIEGMLAAYKKYFESAPLSYKQMLDMVDDPRDEEHQDDLTNSGKQQQSVDLLLAQPNEWEKNGKFVFAKAVQKINTPNALDSQTQATSAGFINAVTDMLLDAMKTAVAEARRTNNLDKLAHCTLVFSVLAQPKYNQPIWLRLLQEYAQTPLYEAATSDVLWNFQVWVLQSAMKMVPLPDMPIVLPWLSIPSWEKLGKVLGLGLLTEWENAAIWNLLERAIPKDALSVVQTHEANFKAMLQWILQQQRLEYTEIATRFFAAMVEHGYPKRVDLLLFLLNVMPKEARAIDGLLASVPPMTERQLQFKEIETLLEGYGTAVIAAANASQILAEYIRQYILYLTPDKIRRENVFLLLKQLGQGAMFPPTITLLVRNWLIIGDFLVSGQMSQSNLGQVGQALEAIIQTTQNQPGISSREQFIHAFIPLLVKKVEDEYDLGIITEAFVPSLVGSRWGLLRRLAREAGSLFTPNKEYSRLTPYLLRGLREYVSNNPMPPQNELDEYLRWLYGGVDERVLRSAEEGIFSALWPEWMKDEWEGWRKREHPTLVQKIWPGRRQTDPQPAQPMPVNNGGPPRPAQGYPNQPPVQEGSITPHRRGFAYNPAEPQWNSPPATQSPPQTTVKVPIVVAYLMAYQDCSIKDDYYRAMHTIIPPVLRYWSKWLTENKDKSRSKSSAYEVSTTQDILNDLRDKQGEVSKNLVNYLVDDKLIQIYIRDLEQSNPQSSAFLDPNRWMSLQLPELQAFASELWNQPASQKCAEQALRMLIRRHLFLQYLEDGKKNPKQWIEKCRKDAKVKYM